jgi:Zn-dependent M28 family amino/carboxypeptidase
MHRFAFAVLAAAGAAACTEPAPKPPPESVPGPTPTVQRTSMAEMPGIDADLVLANTKVLASDEFEGRGPGTKGEDRTVAYLIEQFRAMGLTPGNPNGTYVQKVPLVGITAAPAPLVLRKGAEELTLKWKDDVVGGTKRVVESVTLDESELVFVGYGVVAPEYGWDDYKDVDVKGKTLVMLVNDPPIPDPSNPAQLDPKMFGGSAMTYYGRWTYKFEIASEQGAAGAFIIHETGPAGYGFDVVQGSWTGEQSDLVVPDKNMGRVAIQGWVSNEQGRALLTLGGQDLDALKQQAATREFKPVALGVTASMTIKNTLRRMESQNVLARVEGRDPTLRNEHVVYMAHWDHLGVGEPVDGDRIYNGAVDNAVGTAGILEIARAFTRLPSPPKRSILFLAVTAEEQGLLGSEYYAAAPVYPLARTVATINIDTLNVRGRTRDLTIIGYGASELDDYARDATGEQGRIVRPDPEPEKGFYYRSDHFNFAKQGVPALYADEGVEFIGKPADYGRQMREQYTTRDYHKPSDIVRPDWDMSGAREDLQVFFAVGYRVAEADRMPEWRPGNEFRARREAQLKGEGGGR